VSRSAAIAREDQCSVHRWILPPFRCDLIEPARQMPRERAAADRSLGRITRRLREHSEGAAGDHQLHRDIQRAVVFAAVAAGVQDAQGFGDAGRLVAADRAGHVDGLALAQVVARGEQREFQPVSQRQRRVPEHALVRAQPTVGDLQHVAFVVIDVEVVAEAAVAQAQPREPEHERIPGAVQRGRDIAPEMVEQALSAPLHPIEDVGPLFQTSERAQLAASGRARSLASGGNSWSIRGSRQGDRDQSAVRGPVPRPQYKRQQRS
jgi:hypothetical protein